MLTLLFFQVRMLLLGSEVDTKGKIPLSAGYHSVCPETALMHASKALSRFAMSPPIPGAELLRQAIPSSTLLALQNSVMSCFEACI